MGMGALCTYAAYNILFSSKLWYRFTTNFGLILRGYALIIPGYYLCKKLKTNEVNKFIQNNKDTFKQLLIS
jgi:hypothetical protein